MKPNPKREKNLYEMWSKAEEILDNYNSDNGDIMEYCKLCGANRYDSRGGIIHLYECPIITIRRKYMQKTNLTNSPPKS